jgi:hypothetical protein
MRMHGFTADQLAELVRTGFAATTTERMVGEWRQPPEVKRFKINHSSRKVNPNAVNESRTGLGRVIQQRLENRP